MEKPEKLYCMHRLSGDYSCSTTPFAGGDEYIRTDAFIKKACAFLTNEANIPLWEGNNGTFGCDTSKLVQNFINYMSEI